MLHAERQPKALAELPDERLVRIRRLAAQVMVHVEHMQALAGDARPTATVVQIEL